MHLSEARHAFVTGGASGLGLGIADALAARGVAVTIADINDEALAQVVASRGNSFRGVVLDTRDREGWQRAKAEAETALGPVDILISNAGIAPNGKGFAEMDPESFDRIIAINLTGIYNGIWAFAGDMARRGKGHIVCTSSQAGLVTTVTGVGAYSAAKFGVTAIGEALRAELAPQGVGVSLLFPGYVQTNLAANTQRIGGDIRQYSNFTMTSDVTPADVGEMVAEAIEQDAPYIITHKDIWPGVERRMTAIKAACDYRLEH
ncbi:MAG: SDR family oxidoreductase [Novosphingobium sp.]|jgi:NAD(P)-dependent dehydrogenase (short-subunit alcohol dehydrogenase family)|nr:SDR family oxidoreductase [Novosphingobium sp.]